MTSPSPPIIVWLVEDNDIYRTGLSRTIEAAAGMRCPRAFADAESAFAAITTDMIPDVILPDVGLPEMDGLSALRRFATLSPETRIVLLTAFNDTDKIFEAVCAGA